MSRNAFSKSQVFLMEFILVILFFALCGAICIKAFVKADALSRESLQLNQGMLLVQSAVECVKATPASQLPNALKTELNMDETRDGEYRSYYDREFKHCGVKDAAYLLELHLSHESDVLHAEAQVMKLGNPIASGDVTENREASTDTKELICSLSADKYTARESDDDA